ncbi:MAG: 3-deoxy-D-manno-octulosonic acid transferase, partial [Paracoccaceae bacterium]|nr:3-deoxy-D-manno-octulosonic acid transferase [Paracoccaceae bacterium]
GAAMAIARQKFRWPGVKRKALQAFNYVLAGDPATSKALIRAGAKKANVAVTGVIEPTMPALPCHDGEREDFAGLLTARPVWLAAEVTLGEAELIIAAHALAIRKTHRLLLIIVPSDAGDTPEFQKLLNQYDLIYEQRSALMDPDKETQVYLADTTDEMGLWYRLAPVSYIGGTGRGSKDPGPSPFDAAALGSAILHGPVTQAHQSQFERLSRANAAIQVVNAEDLAFAVTSLGAPDRAAEMAHSAWSVCSAGAEAIERVHDLLTVAIERRKKKP